MHINYLAVVVAAVINMVVGAVWYSPGLFAKQWMKATGKSIDQTGSPGPAYGLMALGSLVMAWMLAFFIGKLSLVDFGSGLTLGIMVWLGFVVFPQAANYIFEGRSVKLFAINVGYFLVSFALMGGLLAAWH